MDYLIKQNETDELVKATQSQKKIEGNEIEQLVQQQLIENSDPEYSFTINSHEGIDIYAINGKRYNLEVKSAREKIIEKIKDKKGKVKLKRRSGRFWLKTEDWINSDIMVFVIKLVDEDNIWKGEVKILYVDSKFIRKYIKNELKISMERANVKINVDDLLYKDKFPILDIKKIFRKHIQKQKDALSDKQKEEIYAEIKNEIVIDNSGREIIILSKEELNALKNSGNSFYKDIAENHEKYKKITLNQYYYVHNFLTSSKQGDTKILITPDFNQLTRKADKNIGIGAVFASDIGNYYYFRNFTDNGSSIKKTKIVKAKIVKIAYNKNQDNAEVWCKLYIEDQDIDFQNSALYEYLTEYLGVKNITDINVLSLLKTTIKNDIYAIIRVYVSAKDLKNYKKVEDIFGLLGKNVNLSIYNVNGFVDNNSSWRSLVKGVGLVSSGYSYRTAYEAVHFPTASLTKENNPF